MGIRRFPSCRHRFLYHLVWSLQDDGSVVESLAEKYAGKIDFYKVDIDQESELASVFGISSIPTFLFIPVKGKPSVQMGAMQKEDFEGLIDKIKIK